jgi:hypothetical protein
MSAKKRAMAIDAATTRAFVVATARIVDEIKAKRVELVKPRFAATPKTIEDAMPVGLWQRVSDAAVAAGTAVTGGPLWIDKNEDAIAKALFAHVINSARPRPDGSPWRVAPAIDASHHSVAGSGVDTDAAIVARGAADDLAAITVECKTKKPDAVKKHGGKKNLDRDALLYNITVGVGKTVGHNDAYFCVLWNRGSHNTPAAGADDLLSRINSIVFVSTDQILAVKPACSKSFRLKPGWLTTEPGKSAEKRIKGGKTHGHIRSVVSCARFSPTVSRGDYGGGGGCGSSVAASSLSVAAPLSTALSSSMYPSLGEPHDTLIVSEFAPPRTRCFTDYRDPESIAAAGAEICAWAEERLFGAVPFVTRANA